MSRRIWQRGIFWLSIVLISLGTFLGGCEDTPEDRLMDGRRALSQNDADLAEEYFQKAIEANPEMTEPRRLMANVHMMRGEFEAAERVLQKLWDDEGLEREADLSTDDHSTRQIVYKQFGDLYHRWAESIDFAESPDEFERIVAIGLEHNSRDSHLNPMMVEYYQQRAERLIERSEKIDAAEVLEKIDTLQAFPDVRRESRQRAQMLRREAFGEEAHRRFDDELRAALIEDDAFDPETEKVSMATEIDSRLNPADDLEQARNMAVQTLIPTLGQFAVALGGLDEDEEIKLDALKVPTLTVVDEDFRTGHYDMVVTLELEEVIDIAFEYFEFERLRSDAETVGRSEDRTMEVAIESDTIELDTSAVDSGE